VLGTPTDVHGRPGKIRQAANVIKVQMSLGYVAHSWRALLACVIDRRANAWAPVKACGFH